MTRLWTPAEDEAALTAQARGLTYGEIGLQLGRTQQSVGSRLNRIVRQEPSFNPVMTPQKASAALLAALTAAHAPGTAELRLPESAPRTFPRPLDHSPCGSPAAMCNSLGSGV